MSFDPLKPAARAETTTASSPVPMPLVGLAVMIAGWIVMAGTLGMVDGELPFFSGFITGFCFVITGFGIMIWAER